MKTRDARSLPSIAQEDLRHKGVKAVLSGKKQKEVAEVFGVSRKAVGNWVKAYRQGGSATLKRKPKGRPRGSRSLNPKQAAWVAKTIVDKRPDQIKLPFYLWTREAVQRLIAKRYGIHVSVWTIGRYLAEWGFTPQKPIRRAYEQDPKAIKRWLKESYPQIRQQANQEGADIYWGDEMGMRSDHQSGRSYAPRGQTPVIEGTGQRFRGNMISAITNKGRLMFMVFKHRFTTDVFIQFLKRLIRQNRRKVFLIVDGHPAHRSKKLKQWLKQHVNAIHLFYLPAYAPELNPDEMLNHDVKANAVGRKRARHAEELVGNVRRYLRRRQHQPEIVKKYFHHTNTRYAAN